MSAAVGTMAPTQPFQLEKTNPSYKTSQDVTNSRPRRCSDDSASASASRSTRPVSPQSSPPINQEEIRGAYRARSIEVIAQAGGDVAAFLEELEVKRKQLDEQIQRYIKQKDREFKIFERDLRPKYRSKPVKQEESAVKDHDEPAISPKGTNEAKSTSNDVSDPCDRDNHTQISNGKTSPDPKAVQKREAELLGLFTPEYLPLLGKESSNPTERSPSAPPQLGSLDSREIPAPDPLLRAHSDSIVVAASPLSPERLRIENRSLSGGLEPIKPLVGVLRAPTGQARLPKKRVSLVVGDEIVIPSDDVSTSQPPPRVTSLPELSGNTSSTISHTRSHSSHADMNTNIVSLQTNPFSNGDQTEETSSGLYQHHNSSASQYPSMPISALSSSLARTSTAGDEDDEFDMESPFTMDDDPTPRDKNPWIEPMPRATDDQTDTGSDFLDHAEQIEDVQLGKMPSPIQSPLTALSTQRSPSTALPTPSVSISKVRTSSSASLQPVSPGFSRPSVTEDPQLLFADQDDITTPEIEDNKSYGSFSQSGSYMDRKGSLGESFMMRNAAEMMRRRKSSGSSGG
ncbi:hypothetical protein MBLNU457_6608t1 [Dothideomycetes sp. NU457]